MLIYNLLFYMFSTLLVISAFGVISVKNTVYSVLLLIFAFFNAAGLFVMLGAEFLAMTIVIVYVGAVAVLFLFVVMMLNINLTEIKETIIKNVSLLVAIAALLLANLVIVVYSSIHAKKILSKPTIEIAADVSNTKAIGLVLYTDYSLAFEIAGIILLVAMIGAILLTYRKDLRYVKKQDTKRQLSRTKESGMQLISVKTGEGVDAISK